ncbi:type VI secretion system baseplate subunit TssE [Acidovorax sp. SUPP950]|uniref:type VI secretion system baseplate subunit TssE n=1 Tax=unclassified Acidovorax TaxID=2684926 RepID=UPI00234A612A|nr:MULTISPECIES: type VI secretion system baseplate subunit TssE [Comamonadaceae]WCM90136.1 type VI secretion system baseplate subunit TssE [Acidovorax sp. NCPPB 3576]WOI47232.1 type VI secretion system baseplate subunit TssE [Paracidovorax avenae]GKS76686.1 type VI secretion system baseplate subunit TssE [Acidovorax sp. SUPP950]GKS84347.1 type VI secretion system baseplate subunit TssE [Acidovorax sp. SUPP1855]GKS96810.1 type VI secretion system baseplate subunit TssE [Acidovorax sp. SUPP2825
MATTRPNDNFGNGKDRLQPALLDRLTDHEPSKRTERADAVYVTEARLRQALLRDLNWLLNASDATSHIDFEGLPEAERSVINFGMTPLAGQLLSELDWKDIEKAIRKSILAHEPRILRDTLTVALAPSSKLFSHHNTLQFEIRCQFWSAPYPMELLLKTSLDLETGQVVVSDLR